MKISLLLLSCLVLLAGCNDDSEPATADFTLPTEGEQGIEVAFQNQSQNAKRYVWTFGDGSTTQDRNPTHIYTARGTYSVKLVAFGAEGKDSVFKSITIRPFDIHTHSTVPIAGSYTCKMVCYSVRPWGSFATRLSDQVVTITKPGPGQMLLNATTLMNTITLTYVPFNRTSPQRPNTILGAYVFYNQYDANRATSEARFYTSGDSARFQVDQPISAGANDKTIYTGIRRP